MKQAIPPHSPCWQPLYVLTVAFDDSVWDVAAGIEKSRLQGHAGWVSCLALSSDNKTLFSGSHDQNSIM